MIEERVVLFAARSFHEAIRVVESPAATIARLLGPERESAGTLQFEPG